MSNFSIGDTAGYLELVSQKTTKEKVLDKIKLLDKRYAAHMKAKKENTYANTAQERPVYSVAARDYFHEFLYDYSEIIPVQLGLSELQSSIESIERQTYQAPRPTNPSKVPSGLFRNG